MNNERAEMIREYYSLDMVVDSPPENWVELVSAALGDADPGDSDAVQAALRSLGLLK